LALGVFFFVMAAETLAAKTNKIVLKPMKKEIEGRLKPLCGLAE
jgi:hypothetical protein